MTIPTLPLLVGVFAAATISTTILSGEDNGGGPYWAHDVLDGTFPCAMLPLQSERIRCRQRRRIRLHPTVMRHDQQSDENDSHDDAAATTSAATAISIQWPRGGGIDTGDDEDVVAGETTTHVPTAMKGNDEAEASTEEETLDASTATLPQTTTTATTNTSTATPRYLLPWIDTRTVSMALRMTCEINRRLSAATTTKTTTTAAGSGGGSNDGSISRGGGIIGGHFPPPPGSATGASSYPTTMGNEEITMFHAAKPYRGDDRRTGVSRWGPDLEVFLDALLFSIGLEGDADGDADSDSHGDADNDGDSDDESGVVNERLISQPLTSSGSTTPTNTRTIAKITPSHRGSDPWDDERQLILALAVVYLDRSSSADANAAVAAEDPVYGSHARASSSSSAVVPPLSPRTVHRSVLTALSIAAKCVRSGSSAGGEGVPMSSGDISRALLSAAASTASDNNYNDGDGNGGNIANIDEADLERMERAMLRAMCDYSASPGGASSPQQEEGWIVRPTKMREFMSSWGRTFYPSRVESREALAAADAARASRRLERWVRERAAGAAAAVGLGRNSHHHQGGHHHPSSSELVGGVGYYYDHGHGGGGGLDPEHHHGGYYQDPHHHEQQQQHHHYQQQQQQQHHHQQGAEWGDHPLAEAEAGDSGYQAAAASWQQAHQYDQSHNQLSSSQERSANDDRYLHHHHHR